PGHRLRRPAVHVTVVGGEQHADHLLGVHAPVVSGVQDKQPPVPFLHPAPALREPLFGPESAHTAPPARPSRLAATAALARRRRPSAASLAVPPSVIR